MTLKLFVTSRPRIDKSALSSLVNAANVPRTVTISPSSLTKPIDVSIVIDSVPPPTPAKMISVDLVERCRRWWRNRALNTVRSAPASRRKSTSNQRSLARRTAPETTGLITPSSPGIHEPSTRIYTRTLFAVDIAHVRRIVWIFFVREALGFFGGVSDE